MKFRASLASLFLFATGCSQHEARLPTSPTPADGGSVLAVTAGPLATFPDRSESVQFRIQLENVYRTEGYPLITTYVDVEGSVIWITEYVRYRTSGCSDQVATSNVNFMIDNLNSPPRPECGSTAEFPPRQESFAFRTQYLEPKYRDGLQRSLQPLYVNPEGDVIWTTEYLRYRDSGCGHLEATARVNIAVRTFTTPPDCKTQPGPIGPGTSGPTPQARFVIVPNSNTVNPGQCSVRSAASGGGTRNVLLCTFDATTSTPRPGITTYEWAIDGQDGQTNKTGERLFETTLPCGQFGDTDVTEIGKIFQKNVRLTVTSPGGTNSTQQLVTFVKSAPC